MKRAILLFIGILSCTLASAQYDDFFEDDNYYRDYYYDRDDDDIYRYGFNINNYASAYPDLFITNTSREYGIRKSDVRYYLRAGFSPSDILFGAELSRRSGRAFNQVMDMYYRSSNKNWINITINLGIPRGSIGYRNIILCFRDHYGYWNRHYRRYHPHSRPPMYNHSWSYFRPTPTPSHNNGRPNINNRPGRPDHNPGYGPGNRRPGSTTTTPPKEDNHKPSYKPGQNGNNNDSGNNGNRRPSTRPSTSPSKGDGNTNKGGSYERRDSKPSTSPSKSDNSNKSGESNKGGTYKRR